MNFNMHFLVLDILFWPKYANILKLIKNFYHHYCYNIDLLNKINYYLLIINHIFIIGIYLIN